MISHVNYSRNTIITIMVIIFLTCNLFAGTTGKIAG